MNFHQLSMTGVFSIPRLKMMGPAGFEPAIFAV